MYLPCFNPHSFFVLGHFIFWPDEHSGGFFSEILVKCITSGSSGGWLPHVTRRDGCQTRHQAAASETQGTPMRWESAFMMANSCKFESELSGNWWWHQAKDHLRSQPVAWVQSHCVSGTVFPTLWEPSVFDFPFGRVLQRMFTRQTWMKMFT